MGEQVLNGRVITRISATDQSGISATLYGEDGTGQYLFQMEDSSTGSVQPATLDAIVTGVQQEKPKAGAACQIALGEIVKVVYGDTILLSAPEVCSDANGRAIPIASNHNSVGFALDAGVVGDVGRILIRSRYKA